MSIGFVKLGDVCEIKRGTTITQKNAVEGNVPVVAGGIKPTYYHNAPNRLGKTITISGSGANAGYVNLWDVPIFASDCSTVQVNREDLSINYVHYFLLSKQDYIYKELRSGAAQPHVYGKDIANIEINLPSLDTQQKIVKKLDAIFAEIDRATVATETNVKNADALFQSYLTEIFEEINSNFVKIEIGNLCENLHQGLNTAGEKVKFYDEGYPIIQTRNIDNSEIDITEKIKFLCFEDWEKYKEKYKPQVGDVFFTNIGTIGKTAIVEIEDDYLIHWNIFKIRPNISKISSLFFKNTLDYLTLSGYFKSLQKGGTVEFVTKKMIAEAIVGVPRIEQQKKYCEQINGFKNQVSVAIECYSNKLINFNLLKKSILKQAFNGELVKE